MLHIYILCVGKLKEQYLKDACLEYQKRLSKYCHIDLIELPDEKIPDKCNEKIALEIKEQECKKILANIPKDSYVISLDLKGKQFSSEEFSQKIESISFINSSITFIIGGSLGLTHSILQHSHEFICFSKMTFPHQLIRVFLLEQIYRAFKISHNESYHK